jgi:hypothetical protein
MDSAGFTVTDAASVVDEEVVDVSPAYDALTEYEPVAA